MSFLSSSKMMFEEKESFSPMKNNIIEQSARIHEIVSNAGKFKKYYNELVNNVIDSMNNQCDSYERNSKKAIKADIYEMVMKSINWDALQKKLVADLKGNKRLESIPEWEDIEEPDVEIEKYDTDAVVNMYSNFNEENVKDYSRYMKEAINGLTDVIKGIDDFENALCEYRSETVKNILEKNVPVLYAVHYRYVRDLMNKKKNIEANVMVGGVNLELKKSQKEFFEKSLKKFLN